jgi:hypothetical protein
MPRTEINPVHAVPPATAEDALAYLREHRGMSYQHMDALLAYVESLRDSAQTLLSQADQSEDAPDVTMVSTADIEALRAAVGTGES